MSEQEIISGSAYGRQWACNKTEPTVGKDENRLTFYEYKWLRWLLQEVEKFREKNGLNERNPDKDDKIPYFVYRSEPAHLRTLIDKMTKRMEEFEPYISKHTTAHTGYWDV